MENIGNCFDFKSVMATTAQTDNSVTTVLMAPLGNYRLLCFNKLHLHDIGDAILMKRMLAVIFQRALILLWPQTIRLMFCEQHCNWIIEAVPALTRVSTATQQWLINVIDVLYDRNYRFFLISEHTQEEMKEDIQRMHGRLNQLKHYVSLHSSHNYNGLGRN